MVNAKTWNPAQIDQAIRRLEGIIRSGSYNPAELNQLLNQLGESGYINTWNPAELDQKLRTLLYDLLSWKTTTGNPIQLRTNNGGLVQSCEVTFSPIQSGSGDPSPTNIRPISGRDSLVLTRTGKNLFDISKISASGITVSDGVVSGQASYFLAYNEASGGISSICDLKYPYHGQVTISIEGYTNGATTSGNGLGLYVKYTDNTSEYVRFANNQTTKTKITRTTDANKDIAIIYFSYSSNGSNVWYLSNIQIEYGTTSTSYEPYQGQTHTATFPDTKYGGSYEFVSGKGKSEWAYIASYDGETITEPWISSIDVYVPETTPSTGAEVCYKLASPVEIPLLEESIELLTGDNVLWTDGDSIEITYKKLLLPSDVEELSKNKKIKEKPKTTRSKKKKEE